MILQYILKNFRLVSFANTRAGRKLFFRLEKERARMLQETGEATPRLLAESLDVSEEDVVAAQAARLPALSLTGPRSPGDDESRSLGETIASGEAGIDEEVARHRLLATVDEKMHAFYETLTDERDKAVWMERLVSDEPKALAELGDRFGVSRERIRQIEARLKKRLKDYLTQELGPDIRLDFGGTE
jgi:RNA polymerase sigma-32 factor